ncbi:MAG: tetratricopeptide repeat protein [Candidatus Omnitrophota bacterium]
MYIKLSFLLCFLIIFSQHKGYSQDDKSLYNKGVAIAKRGDTDVSFMYFNRLINDFPESKYLKEALFAAGEYRFSIGDYSNSGRMLSQLINNYPQAENKPFAMAYLIKINSAGGKKNEVEKLTKELAGVLQLSLVFRDFKELKYASPLSKNYKALYFINKVQIYIDDKLFAEIPF